MVIESAYSGNKPQTLDVSNKHAGRMGYFIGVDGERTGITNTWSSGIVGKIVDRHLASTWI